MIKTLRRLAICRPAPACLPAAGCGQQRLYRTRFSKSLKVNKISSQSLSVVTIPLNGPGNSTFFNADISVNPASTMKLVTTYAALELLGPTHQWKTEFFTDGQLKNGVLNGNLYLKGGGDPKLNMEKLWLLMRDLRANGVLQVNGDLVLDRSHFVQPQLPSFNDDGGDANKPYLVTPDSLLVNLKALRFIARTEGGKVLIAAEPPIANIRIDNRVKALPASQMPGLAGCALQPSDRVRRHHGDCQRPSWPKAAARRPTCRCSTIRATPPARSAPSGRNWAAASWARTASPRCRRKPACWRALSPRT